MNDCVICSGSSPCFQCQIDKLTTIVELQKQELKYLRKESNKHLLLEKDYSKYFETDNRYLPLNLYGKHTDYHFLTLTFDPAKFGLFNNPCDEKNFIFATLYKARKWIRHLTGCFEYQKNGTTHAHLLLSLLQTPNSPSSDKDIEDWFRKFYTDNPKNKYAIKCYPAKFPTVEDYIKKESTEYYRYDPSNGLDDVPIMPSVEADQPIKIVKPDHSKALKLIEIWNRSKNVQVNFN